MAEKRPKFDPDPNIEETVRLKFTEAKSGENAHGQYFLLGIIHVQEDGDEVEKTWFLPERCAVWIRDNCNRDEVVTVQKRMKSGEKAHYWFINGQEVPFGLKWDGDDDNTAPAQSNGNGAARQPASNGGSAPAGKPASGPPADTMDRRSALHAAVEFNLGLARITLDDSKQDTRVLSSVSIIQDAELFTQWIQESGSDALERVLKKEISRLAGEWGIPVKEVGQYANATYGSELKLSHYAQLVEEMRKDAFGSKLKDTLQAVNQAA